MSYVCKLFFANSFKFIFLFHEEISVYINIAVYGNIAMSVI